MEKLVLITDLDGNEFTVKPNVIINVIENGNHTLVETIYGNELTKSSKQVIQASIHNCYLP